MRAEAGSIAPRELTEVARGVWTATAVTWTSLTTIIVAADGSCLVVDPGITVAELDGLVAAISARGWRVAAGFSTHPHWDHLLWSTALGDVPRWATARGAAVATTTHDDAVAKAAEAAPGHDAGLLGRVTALPPGTREIPWTGPRAIVVAHQAHCPGHAALALPDAGVLLAGDMLSDLEIPLLDADATDPLADYRVALDLLEAATVEHGVRTVVPGHGHVGDASELARRLAADRAYLATVAAGGSSDDPRMRL